MSANAAFDATSLIAAYDFLIDEIRTFLSRPLMDYSVEELEMWANRLRGSYPKNTIQAVPRDHHQVWHRGRQSASPDEFTSLLELIYPPSDKVSLGRANLAGEPVFYCSWNEPTMQSELRLDVGDYLYSIRVRPREGEHIVAPIIGEYSQIANGGSSLVNQRANEQFHHSLVKDGEADSIASYFDDFLADQYAHQVSNGSEYRFTAMFAKPILELPKTGLIYPSVCRRAGINLALSKNNFDELFEVLTAEVWRVTRNYGKGHVFADYIKHTCDFEEDGTINWAGPRSIRMSFDHVYGYRFAPGTKGWRVAS